MPPLTITPSRLTDLVRSYFPYHAPSVGEHLSKELGLYTLQGSSLATRALYLIASDLDIDSDGSGLAGDPTAQAETSLRDTHGKSLNANTVPFFVLPGHWGHGAKLGDYGVIWTEDYFAYFICGDIGPGNKIGEGSLELARRLGHERVVGGRVRDYGIGQNVRVLIFPGSGSGVFISNADIVAKAVELVAAL